MVWVEFFRTKLKKSIFMKVKGVIRRISQLLREGEGEEKKTKQGYTIKPSCTDNTAAKLTPYSWSIWGRDSWSNYLPFPSQLSIISYLYPKWTNCKDSEGET